MTFSNKNGKFLWVTTAVILAVSTIVYSATNYYVTSRAEEKIRDLLLSHKGVHHYVQKIMHPALYDYKKNGEITEDFYAPELFSSSFLVRNMHQFYNEERSNSNLSHIYYKMAAINPRNPVNKADEREEKLIKMFNKDKSMKDYREIIKTDNKKYLFYAQPFLQNTDACLRCHGNREDAPLQLQERYKGQGGFGEKVGDIRAIISVKAPFEDEYHKIFILSFAFLSGLVAFFFLLFFNKQLRKRVELKTNYLTTEIAERKLTESKLRDSENRYRTLISQAADAIFLHDMNGAFIDVNQSACASLGYTREELLEMSVKDIETEFISNNHETQYWKKLTVKAPVTFEGFHRRKDGSTFPVEIRIGLLYLENRSLILSLARDITKRKESHEKLKKWWHIFQDSRWGVVVSDADRNTLEMMNPAYAAMHGYTIEELTGLEVKEVFEPSFRDKLPEILQKCHEKGHYTYEANHIRKDGSIFPAYNDVTTVKNGNGEILYRIVYLQDITERKIVEKEKAKLEDQLRQAHKMEAIGTMAGGIAHDFNNILAIILGNIDMALDDIPAGNPARYNIEQVLEASNRAKELVKQILTFSRQSEQRMTGIDPFRVIEDSLKLLRSTVPATVTIIQTLDQESCTIKADPTQIHQMLMNFFSNAVHAMDEKGTVEIRVKTVELGPKEVSIERKMEPGKYLEIRISDTGIGMNHETRQRIFDPFYTTKEVDEGTGMGLSITLGIVKSHKGFIKVDSEPGKGTVFTVYLPAIADVQPQESGDHILKEIKGNERILFIDDEEMLAEMGGAMLERLGYEVNIQTSSKTALKEFEKDPAAFDLVITDQTMPEMSGAELAAKMLKKRADIPIIMNSGYSRKISEENAKDIGIRDYLLKPLEKKQLATTIRKVLDDNIDS